VRSGHTASFAPTRPEPEITVARATGSERSIEVRTSRRAGLFSAILVPRTIAGVNTG